MFAGGFAPIGWAAAEGQTLSIAQNQSLYSKLGTSFGGDGETSFALPDLRGRTPLGAGQGPGLPSYALGDYVGASQRTVGVVPAHSHTLAGGISTGVAGGVSTHLNTQPAVALTPIVALTGLFPPRSAPPAEGDVAEGVSLSGGVPFLGEIAWIAHNDVPEGWAKAEGQTLAISQHDALFALLGTHYGGDGQTTFNLPDLRGRVAVGQGDGPGLTRRFVGDVFGEHEETLTQQHLPSHDHALPNGGQTDPTGGATPQSNLQPSLAVNYAIALQGFYPSQSAPPAEAGDEPSQAPGGSSDPFYASIPMFGFNFAPRGFAQAEGQTLPISQNTALFSLLWDTFGGDGRSVFDLPDLRGRMPVGVGQGPGLDARLRGVNYGAESSVLTEANLPAHTHDLSIPGDYNNDGQVDAADYTVWRDQLGQPAGALPNDPAGGVIGAAQYEQWRDNYGAPAAAAAPATGAAPEPAAALLLAAAGLLLATQRR